MIKKDGYKKEVNPAALFGKRFNKINCKLVTWEGALAAPVLYIGIPVRSISTLAVVGSRHIYAFSGAGEVCRICTLIYIWEEIQHDKNMNTLKFSN